MKKKYIFALLAAVAGLSSCDMDTMPENSIPDTEALQTPTDFNNMREGLYTSLRGVTGSEYMAVETMCDGFNAVAGFSNTYGQVYRWQTTSEDGTYSAVYGNYQGMITKANFIIDGYNKCDMSNTILFTPEAKATISQIKGEAFFTRAYSLFQLAQFFCADYDKSTADAANSGVSYRLDYNPSSDASTYPGRNTLNETYKQINADLDSAAARITELGSVSAARLTVDAVTALRARIALATDNYADAAKYATELINSGTYSLSADDVDLTSLWQEDGGMETIVQFAVKGTSELPTALGRYYLPYTNDGNPDYIPTKDLVELYSDNDYRKTVYFLDGTINTPAGTTGDVLEFNKYIDHGKIWNDNGQNESARFCIEPKLFRIAEMYLIAAEAYAQSGDLKNASAYLNELEASRIANFEDRTYANKDDLMAELKDERRREMVGEGTRLFDLKRWHEGVKRGEPQQLDLTVEPGQTQSTAMNRPANDPRLTWPIPKHELNVNPKIVQNPGW